MDPLDTETVALLGEFRSAQSLGAAQDPDRGVPASDHLLRRGGRRARQFGALAAMALEGGAARRAKRGPTSGSWPGSSTACAKCTARTAAPFPIRSSTSTWDYVNPVDPNPEETREGDERPRAASISRTIPARRLVKAGSQLDGFAQLRDDGSTMCGCWIFSGCYTEGGNQMARRDATDPREAGIAPNWAWAWPANRRILYNRASADPSGKPWNPAQVADRMERRQMGRPRRAGLWADHPAFRRRRPVHHAGGGPRAPVRPRQAGGGPVPRAL